MKALLHATAVALVLSIAPAYAQTVEDPAADPGLAETADTGDDTTVDGTETAAEEEQGFFSRMIPAGLKSYFSEEEEASFQARLDEAQTPQERNAVRQELQRMNQERHLETVQATQREKQALREQRQQQKGFFESMREDFGAIVDGRASNQDFSRGEREFTPSERQTANAGGKSGDHGKSGKSGGGRGNGGGKGSGNGGGKNK